MNRKEPLLIVEFLCIVAAVAVLVYITSKPNNPPLPIAEKNWDEVVGHANCFRMESTEEEVIRCVEALHRK